MAADEVLALGVEVRVLAPERRPGVPGFSSGPVV